jgi:hypothetical protein
MNFYASYSSLSSTGGAGGGVSSLNGETGAVTLVPGPGITIVPAGSNITISSSGASLTNFYHTLTPTDITNKFITLSSTPTAPTLAIMTVVGGPMQNYGTDFTVSGNQLSWSGLFLDGVLVSGDILITESY